jgi:glycosyltransferase involved in cell wall biosynthesis
MISVVLPCKNEEKAVGICINKIRNVFESNKIDGEIIVSDSSSDKSAEIAGQLGARVIKHNKVGYGNALLEGFKNAKGDIIVMGDCDDSYDFLELPILLEALKDNDMVIGTRKYIQKGAMPFLHRFIGNPLLSLTLRILFKGDIKDSHSGFRVIKKDKFEKLNLRTTGMEFASEMIIKAIKNKLKIKEVPIHYYKRKGSSKLKSFSDGWKHLRFMLLYSPFFLFFIPGIFLFLTGLSSMFWIYFGSPEIFGIKLFYHPMFLSSVFIIIGYQLIIFALFAKTYAINHLGEKPIFNKLYKFMTIEKASIFGLLIILLGVIIYSTILAKWLSTNFGALQEIKNSIIALTLVILGIQTIFSSFMLSVLGIKEKK